MDGQRKGTGSNKQTTVKKFTSGFLQPKQSKNNVVSKASFLVQFWGETKYGSMQNDGSMDLQRADLL